MIANSQTSSAYPPEFSEAYDKCLWRFAINAAPQLHDLYIKKSVLPAKTMLDLCCGSGQLCCFFLEKGFSTTGVDLSNKMIEISIKNTAKEYEKNATWIVADVKKFDVRNSFGLVTCTFSSLNLLDNIDELNQVLTSAYTHLTNKGMLIFDLTTSVGATAHNNNFFKDTDEYTIILNGFYNPIMSETAFLNFLGFVKHGEIYKRFEYCQKETIFCIESVVEIINSIGFHDIEFFVYGATHVQSVQYPESFPNIIIKAIK